MSEVYIGQIMMTGFGFAPRNFAGCDGSLMAIGQNQALFSLLGTLYGGDGRQTFALPDLRSRAPAGAGASIDPAWAPAPYPPGLVAGTETVTLLNVNLPLHTHVAQATTSLASTPTPPAGGFLAKAANSTSFYAAGGQGGVPLAPATLAIAGSSAPHPNVQPSLAINFNIATNGYFPSRS